MSKSLKDLADEAFSRYIRQKYAIGGFVLCVTCGTNKRWQEVDAGHFISRGKNSTRFDERNVFPQCKQCNIFKGGAKPEYALFLVRAFGEGIIEELVLLGNQTKQWKKWELEELVAKFTSA